MSEFSIVCTKENLLQGLTRVTPIAGRNTQLPILGHVLIRSKNGALSLTTTDLEVGAHTVVGGKVTGSGAVTIPARGLFTYIQGLPTGNPITIDAKKNTAHITTTGFSAQFPVGNPDDFPLLPKGKKDAVLVLSGVEFCRALGRVLFAAARDETRPEIRGVYVHIQDKTIHLAATDSFRLAEEVMGYVGDESVSYIIPFLAAQEIVRLFTNQESISLAPQDNHILIFSDDLEVTSRVVDGSYPDYQQIIPKSSTTTLTISREDFLQALKTLLVFLPRDSRRVELIVDPEKNNIIAQVASGSVGEGRVSVQAEIDGEQTTVLLNIQYLLEGLQHITSDTCVIELSGEARPLVLRPTVKNSKYVYVVMPIRA